MYSSLLQEYFITNLISGWILIDLINCLTYTAVLLQVYMQSNEEGLEDYVLKWWVQLARVQYQVTCPKHHFIQNLSLGQAKVL